MQFFALDFETFYAAYKGTKDYTLKKMHTDQYIHDPRFQALVLSIYNPTTQVVLPREAIPNWLARINPAETGVICQNALFDVAILKEHYGFVPGFIVDTLAMSRAIEGLGVKHSLAAQCERYGLPPKTVDYGMFDGKRWEDLTPHERERLGDQCMGDSMRTWAIAQIMLPQIPDEELRVIDLTTRMFTEPTLVGDVERLTALVQTERDRKQALIDELGLDEKDLTSDIKFEKLLERLNVTVAFKPSKDKRGFKGCFAKSDPFMQELLDHEDEYVQGVAQLRIDLKSTIQQSRAERFLEMARRGPLPVFYNYYGTDTSHWSGGEATNFQNLPSRGKNGVELRKSVKAPPRHKLVVGDMSQIQCRMLCSLAGQHDKLQAFREKRDLYCELATKFFGRPITKADEFERQMGKVGTLQLGFQSGWGKVQGAAKRQFDVDLTEAESKLFVKTYRDDNTRIAGRWEGRTLCGGIWQSAESWLTWLAQGFTVEVFAPTEDGQPSSDKPIFTIKDQSIIMPTGLKLHYKGLHWGEFMRKENGQDIIKQGWKLPRIDGFKVLYGGKMTQNIVAAFSRLAFSQAELRSQERMRGWGRIALHTHDDFGAVVPENRAEEASRIVMEELTRVPAWLPNIPLNADVKILEDYAK